MAADNLSFILSLISSSSSSYTQISGLIHPFYTLEFPYRYAGNGNRTQLSSTGRQYLQGSGGSFSVHAWLQSGIGVEEGGDEAMDTRVPNAGPCRVCVPVRPEHGD